MSQESYDIEAPEELPRETPPSAGGKSVTPPEGGVAGWLAVTGSTLCVFTTFGFLNA